MSDKPMPEFHEFPKMPRLSRECIITEKLDGTNAQILITEEKLIFAGSRNRWITPADDNFGFAAWCLKNADELIAGLGTGRHFGEWLGSGIQRGYGLKNGEKRFSLFNASRWCAVGSTPLRMPSADPRVEKVQDIAPACCGVVPVLYRGEFHSDMVTACIEDMRIRGSYAAPGFMRPEGVVCYHIAAGVGFKKTLEKDSEPKGLTGGAR